MVVDASGQIFVTVDGNDLLINVDYTVVGDDIVFASPPSDGAIINISRRMEVQLDQQTYYNVEQDATSGSGTGAEFTINRTRGNYDTTITVAGSDYLVGDTVTIDAATIGGGSSPANDLTITVLSVDVDGGIVTFSTSGSGVSNTSVFPLEPHL